MNTKIFTLSLIPDYTSTKSEEELLDTLRYFYANGAEYVIEETPVEHLRSIQDLLKQFMEYEIAQGSPNPDSIVFTKNASERYFKGRYDLWKKEADQMTLKKFSALDGMTVFHLKEMLETRFSHYYDFEGEIYCLNDKSSQKNSTRSLISRQGAGLFCQTFLFFQRCNRFSSIKNPDRFFSRTSSILLCHFFRRRSQKFKGLALNLQKSQSQKRSVFSSTEHEICCSVQMNRSVQLNKMLCSTEQKGVTPKWCRHSTKVVHVVSNVTPNA